MKNKPEDNRDIFDKVLDHSGKIGGVFIGATIGNRFGRRKIGKTINAISGAGVGLIAGSSFDRSPTPRKKHRTESSTPDKQDESMRDRRRL